MFNQRYGYRWPIRGHSHTFSTIFAPSSMTTRMMTAYICMPIKMMTMVKKAGKPCLIGDTAIAGPLATRGRLLRHLRPDFRRDTGATHHFMPLQPMGGGAAPPTALMSSPQKAAREGKKSPKAGKVDEKARVGLQLDRDCKYLHNAGTYDQAVDNQQGPVQRMFVDRLQMCRCI